MLFYSSTYAQARTKCWGILDEPKVNYCSSRNIISHSKNIFYLICIYFLDIKPVVTTNEKIRSESKERNKPKEAPSDPRRRRRTSESSSSSTVTTRKETPQPVTPKKSPRNDEPPSKVRKSESRNTLNSIARKISYLLLFNIFI